MSTISTNDYLSSLSVTSQSSQEAGSNEELGQNAFLELMIAQLENQSPLDPKDNTEFVAQLAQFSSVESLDKLNNNFDQFTHSFISNQALQASSLVGSMVAVPASEARLNEGSIVGGIIELPASTSDMSMSIYSDQGELVEEIPLGSQPAGDVVFRWDGNRIEVNGQLLAWQSEQPIAAGDFRFDVIATQNGEPEQLATSLTANVNSVTVDDKGHLTLNLAGIGAVDINDVKQFN